MCFGEQCFGSQSCFAGLSVRGLPPPAGRNGVDPERKAPCYHPTQSSRLNCPSMMTLNFEPSLWGLQVKVLRIVSGCPGPREAGDSSLSLDFGSLDLRSVVMSSHCGMGKKKDWRFPLCFTASQ